MNKLDTKKRNYENPMIEITAFSCADIIATSGIIDETIDGITDTNQGEWDPQGL